MPTLAVTDFNIVCALLGGYISLFGLVSFLVKEKYYLSEARELKPDKFMAKVLIIGVLAVISLLFGVAFSEHGANLIRPLQYALGSEENLDHITLYFSRLVLGVQLVIAGVQLPPQYLRFERKSLALLLGPGMVGMWLLSSLLVWAMVPHITFLQALAVGSCVTPTDPILSNTIVKGKFADRNIPKPLQRIIVAESGANDGLGYPFLFFALYLIKYNGQDGALGAGEAMRLWFAETWAFTILLSTIYGAVVGWLAKELLRACENRKYVDRESFIVFAVSLALFVVGTCGMIGTDDVLACFVAGNVFNWDDWFRLETQDDSLQPTIDMLLNISVFAWFGAVCPWPNFRVNDVIPIWRLIILGILILCFRRLPVVFSMRKWIHQIENWRHAAFTGFFGPIGVSAIFYLYISIEFLDEITVDGQIREDAFHLQNVIRIVVWFMVICSIVVHGLSVPFGKLLGRFPKTMSQALSFETTGEKQDRPTSMESFRRKVRSRSRDRKRIGPISPPQAPTFSLGRPVIEQDRITQQSPTQFSPATSIEPLRPVHFIDTPLHHTPRDSTVIGSQTSSPKRHHSDSSQATLSEFPDHHMV